MGLDWRPVSVGVCVPWCRYTGVYAERFRSGDGRINGDTVLRAGMSFTGDTNTNTDEVIHDISALTRPNLRSGSTTMGNSPRLRETNREAALYVRVCPLLVSVCVVFSVCAC